MGVTMKGKKISLLIYADDMVLISKSSYGLQKVMDALKLFCESSQLIVNTAKSKYMLVTKKRPHDQPITVYNNRHLQLVEHFTYLGVNLSRTNSFTKGLKNVVDKYINHSQFWIYIRLNTYPQQLPTYLNYLTAYLNQNYCISVKYGAM